jgi:hypothetical protein
VIPVEHFERAEQEPHDHGGHEADVDLAEHGILGDVLSENGAGSTTPAPASIYGR